MEEQRKATAITLKMIDVGSSGFRYAGGGYLA